MNDKRKKRPNEYCWDSWRCCQPIEDSEGEEEAGQVNDNKIAPEWEGDNKIAPERMSEAVRVEAEKQAVCLNSIEWVDVKLNTRWLRNKLCNALTY